ncbi:MAG: transcription-repair coupling factor [Dehalococcoidales bacterium]|nr:transcription-repair coupling factor [Dehalococcoidales bacterium]
MDLSGLLTLTENMPAYKGIVKDIEFGTGAGAALLDAAKPFVIAALHRHLHVPVIVVTSHAANSRKLHEQLAAWCPFVDIKILPEPDTLPYEKITTDVTSSIETVQSLSALTGFADDSGSNPPVIITSASAFVRKLPASKNFAAFTTEVTREMEIEPFSLIGMLQSMGYKLEDVVDMPGTVSHRGGIIDIFPPTSDMPARLEFFGNFVESIRIFNPATQRSIGEVPSLKVTPATDLLKPFSSDREGVQKVLNTLDLSVLNEETREQYSREISMLLEREMPGDLHFYTPLFNTESILDYLPENGLVVLDEPANIRLAINDYRASAEALRDEKLALEELPGNYPVPYFTWSEVSPEAHNRKTVRFTSFGMPEEENWHQLDFSPSLSYAGQLPLFLEKTQEMLEKGNRVVVVSHQSSRLSELLEDEDIIAVPVENVTELPPPGSLTLVQGLLDGGWIINSDTAVLTDTEIFGFVKQRRLVRKRPVPHHRVFTDINPGDYVVHIEHGIGKFAGVTRMKAEAGRGEKEYMVIEYSSGDRLYVPTDQIDRIGRYVGAGEQEPVLSRLGTQEWSRTKRKVKNAVEDIAEDLVNLYASRVVVPGYAFSPDTVWQQEVEAAFPYVETPDQVTVQRQVKEDMERTKPMDRLICGDVGYGKTEIAVRAAFKAVMDGKQVAVLVPTTVLAEQHYTTFSQRLSAFPVKVEVLSRFRSHAEQKRITEDLADGKVDICIGTHRLIQKDVQFKELGLLIIDEEQRFGVSHKEYLKKMRQEVDVLTLSATPIPRTLHMSLVGVRDMSVMETPPEERLPIRTYVSEFNDHLVREAILREIERDGQVFFVHNRVQSIGLVTARLQDLIPEARFIVGHGQMAEGELESVMTQFARREYDVLVCTSIIQSGLDMPNVNTLIINRADKFGLTQLHQLRGRVGRGTEVAYAYLLYNKGQRLTPIAETRLRTIVEASELGAGFSIAMKDLEIRGAGTLLGMKQSGHISAVGFNLYTQLLAQAVEEQKARRAGVSESEIISSRLPPPSIDLPVAAFIPADYITDLLTRLDMYQKLADLEKEDQLEVVATEFRDRFGQPPEEVKNLLYAIRLKIRASGTGIGAIATERTDIVVTPFEGIRFEREKLDRLYLEGVSPGRFQIRINLRQLRDRWREVLESVIEGIE